MLKPAMLTFCILITGCSGLSDATTASAVPTRAPVPVMVATAGGTFCNGVRLDGQTVATAAHCLAGGTAISIVELSCKVSLGWSGAPVVQNGALVGILSARGQAQYVDIVQMADATLLDSFP